MVHAKSHHLATQGYHFIQRAGLTNDENVSFIQCRTDCFLKMARRGRQCISRTVRQSTLRGAQRRNRGVICALNPACRAVQRSARLLKIIHITHLCPVNGSMWCSSVLIKIQVVKWNFLI